MAVFGRTLDAVTTATVLAATVWFGPAFGPSNAAGAA
jgi:hypothetical protein